MSKISKGVCYLVGAGEEYGDRFTPQSGDIVVAVDGGAKYLKKWQIEPDVSIGDFDSLGYIPNKVGTIVLPSVKDETDMFAGIKAGFSRGYTEFEIYGGTGGLISHTMANIQSLVWLAKRGCIGRLVSEHEIITVIRNDSLEFDSSKIGTVSVFSLDGESKGVCEFGLKYELDNYLMTSEYPIGVSNEFKGVASKISVKEGILLIIYSK